jgi:hypothetical protein
MRNSGIYGRERKRDNGGWLSHTMSAIGTASAAAA